VKFLPLVRDNPSEPLLPDFLGLRLWLDFRNDALYPERLEQLPLRLPQRPPPGRRGYIISLRVCFLSSGLILYA
jgi:hypothetical protein